MTDALIGLGGLLFAGAVATGLTRLRPNRITVQNWAGRRVPAVLGIALTLGVAAAYPLPFLLEPPVMYPRVGLAGAFAFGLMFWAGLFDDVRGSRARGLRAHISRLRQLRVTTGIVKLFVGVGLGIWLSVLIGGPVWRIVAASVLIAATTNVANALDVRPGRAIKFTIPVLIAAWLASGDTSVTWLAVAGVGGAVGVLPFDLSERGMLGDSGSNPLGLLSGLCLAVILPTWGVLVAAGIALALQVAAETVTISRLIDAVPPLRWFDRLGRRS